MSDYEEVWALENFEDIDVMESNYSVKNSTYRNYGEEYKEAYRVASDFLEGEIWRKYWRDPLSLLKELRCEIYSYSKENESLLKKWSPFINIDSLGEGYCVRKDGVTYILYREDNPCPERKTYVFHHERGHTVGAHSILHKDILLSNNRQKDKLEDEATIIGRNVFLPAFVIKYLLKYFDYEIVKRYYNKVYHVSKQYFDVRCNYLDRDYENMIYPECIREEAEKELEELREWDIFDKLLSF